MRKARNAGALTGCVIAALGAGPRFAFASPPLLRGGEHPPVAATDALMVGSGAGLAVDRDFTGMWSGLDQLPYTGDEVVISTTAPSGEFVDGDMWDGPGGTFPDGMTMWGNQGYGSVGQPYWDGTGLPCLASFAPPPVGGALGAGTMTATGMPTAPGGFDLNTVYRGDLDEYVYNMYTRYNGVFDHTFGIAMNGRLWDGRLAEWGYAAGAMLTGVDLTLFDLDPTLETDIWHGGGEVQEGKMYELDDDEPDGSLTNNCGLYNAARAGQHGQGDPRYFFRLANDDPLNDEHRRHQVDISQLSHTRGVPGSEDRYSRTDSGNATEAMVDQTWLSGFMIPLVDADENGKPDSIEALQPGDLGDAAWHAARFPNHPYPTGMDLNGDGDIGDPGEQPFDMATYVKEIVYNQLLDGADHPAHATPGYQPHPNMAAANGGAFYFDALAGCVRHYLDESFLKMRYLQILRMQAPVVVADDLEGSDSLVTAGLYGVQTGDITTYTDIMVTDSFIEQILNIGYFTTTVPKYGVQFNSVALEPFTAMISQGNTGVGADWNGDGELKNGITGTGNNVYDQFAGGVGESEDDYAAEFTRTTNQSQNYVGLGGRQKDGNGLRCLPNGVNPDTDRVWDLADGPAYAEAQVRLIFDNPDQVLHLILERQNAPVAWAIIVDGVKPILGLGGDVIDDDACAAGDGTYGGVDVTTTTCCQANVGGDCILAADADLGTGGDQYACYLLCIDDAAKEVRLYLGEGDGASNLLATYDYSATECAAAEKFVDGMRIFTTSTVEPAPNPLFCTDVEPADTTNDYLEKMDVDLIAWGYDYCPAPALVAVQPEAPIKYSPSAFVFTGSELDCSYSSVDIQLNGDVSQTGSCVTSPTPGPTSATIAAQGGGIYTVTLDAPVPLQEWTTVVLSVRPACAPTAPATDICFHLGWMPGDVNQDGQMSLADSTEFGNQFNNVPHPTNTYVADVNCDGQVSLADSTRFGNMWNGTSGSVQWQGQGIGAPPDCTCP